VSEVKSNVRVPVDSAELAELIPFFPEINKIILNVVDTFPETMWIFCYWHLAHDQTYLLEHVKVSDDLLFFKSNKI
jgi:hypothetical protein